MDGIKRPFHLSLCLYSLLLDHCSIIQRLFPNCKLGSLPTIGKTLTSIKILDTLGFDKTTTYLIQAPPYVISFIITLAVSWSSGRNLEHGYHIIGPMIVSLIGAALMISTLNVGARYFSMILLCAGPFVGLNVSFSPLLIAIFS